MFIPPLSDDERFVILDTLGASINQLHTALPAWEAVFTGKPYVKPDFSPFATEELVDDVAILTMTFQNLRDIELTKLERIFQSLLQDLSAELLERGEVEGKFRSIVEQGF